MIHPTSKPFICGIIPARGGSKGVAKKNVRLLGRKPLIAHTLEAARESKYLTYTLVSTDDEEIARVVRDNGGEVPFMRPAELAQDDSAMVPVLRHAVEQVEAQRDVTINLVVLLQPSSPFRTAEDIDGCIERFAALQPDVVFSARRSNISPFYNLVEAIPGTPWIRLCNEREDILNRRQEAPPSWISYGAVIAYDRKALFAFEHHLRMNRPAIFEMPEERIFEIDSERDLLWAEFFLAHRGMGK